LIKFPINLTNDFFNDASETEATDLFRLRFNQSGNNSIKHKVIPHTTYFAIKQKRYKRKKTIPTAVKYYKDAAGNKTKKILHTSRPLLLDNSIIVEDFGDPTRQYRMLKKNKTRNEVVPVTLAKRLLRVKRTLVVPAHVNITFITNSYDVIHS
jgi:heme/copper-type cytochrome/quinol oxidase subunit 2